LCQRALLVLADMATKKAPTLTAKQEAFCQAIVSGMSQADAYRKAYNAEKMKPATVQESASRMMADRKIAARVEEIRAPVVAEARYDLKAAMLECEEALGLARDKQDPKAMKGLIELRARLHGLLITKVEDVTDPLKKAIGNMPAEKAQEMLDALNQVDSIRKKSAA
jgi:phage terminase small subunit